LDLKRKQNNYVKEFQIKKKKIAMELMFKPFRKESSGCNIKI
jgi:hypothetical protein